VSLPERTTAKLQMARDGGSGKVQETSFIHIIDSIKSPEDLVARVAELLPPSVFRARKTSWPQGCSPTRSFLLTWPSLRSGPRAERQSAVWTHETTANSLTGWRRMSTSSAAA